MTTELTVLTLAALLQVIQFVLVSVPANIELSPGKLLSPRDPDRLGKPIESQVSVPTSRLFRAFNNHFEALVFFTIACVVITLSDQSTTTTQTAAWIYLAARILYVPAYALGWVPWRSAIWAVGFFATVIMLIAALI